MATEPSMDDTPKCPECGRRPSEATGYEWVHDSDSNGRDRAFAVMVRCPDPIHGAADLGPEALALLRSVAQGGCHYHRNTSCRRKHVAAQGTWCDRCHARALLDRAAAEKEAALYSLLEDAERLRSNAALMTITRGRASATLDREPGAGEDGLCPREIDWEDVGPRALAALEAIDAGAWMDDDESGSGYEDWRSPEIVAARGKMAAALAAARGEA